MLDHSPCVVCSSAFWLLSMHLVGLRKHLPGRCAFVVARLLQLYNLCCAPPVALLCWCRVSKVHHILALQVAGGRVVRLWLRRQLTEEDKDELLHEPLACYSCPFPRESLRLADAGGWLPTQLLH